MHQYRSCTTAKARANLTINQGWSSARALPGFWRACKWNIRTTGRLMRSKSSSLSSTWIWAAWIGTAMVTVTRLTDTYRQLDRMVDRGAYSTLNNQLCRRLCIPRRTSQIAAKRTSTMLASNSQSKRQDCQRIEAVSKRTNPSSSSISCNNGKPKWHRRVNNSTEESAAQEAPVTRKPWARRTHPCNPANKQPRGSDDMTLLINELDRSPCRFSSPTFAVYLWIIRKVYTDKLNRPLRPSFLNFFCFGAQIPYLRASNLTFISLSSYCLNLIWLLVSDWVN